MGTASLGPGCAVTRVPVCGIGRNENGRAVEEEGGSPSRVWAKPPSLSAGLHLLHKEGNHEVSLGMKGGKTWTQLSISCWRMFAA